MRFHVLAIAILLSGCFAGYDSRWGQSAATQRQHAATHAPTLRGESEPSATPERAPARPVRVRVYVTRTYASQVVDVTKTLREILEDATDVSDPAFHVRFELESTRPWDLAKDDDLDASLAALRKADDATEVDWVVGLVGSLPRATQSFHDLGVGALPGRHVVLRAPSSADKFDALERAYGELGEEERRRLQREHRRHRQAAVFLHEVGHTLGAIHERSEESLMFPQYRPRMTSFGPEAARVMRVVLAARDAKTAPEQAKLFRDLGEALRSVPAQAIYEDERKRLVPELDAIAARAEAAAKPAPAAPASPAADSEPADAAKLSPADRATFALARKVLHDEHAHVKAWKTAEPLFAAYPDVRSVQEFRCNLATSVFRFEVARRECDRLMAIDMSPSP